MNKKKVSWTISIGVGMLIVLIALFVCVNRISPENVGVLYHVEKVVMSILSLAISWVSIRLITLLFLDPINGKRAKPLPNIIKDIIGVVVYCIALIVIVTKIYDESMLSIGAFLISSWAVIGLAAKDIIGDCINGVLIDLQGDLEIGDWIQFKDGVIAKIVKMEMTGVDLVLPDDTMLFVSNTMIANGPIVNLSKPEKNYYLGVKVILEHTVPVDRARRILQAAAISSPGVFNNDAVAFAGSAESSGVAYDIYFRIPDRNVWLESRHQVINSITKALHKFGLKICQITGEINVRAMEHEQRVLFDDYCVTDALTALKMSKLLENCDESMQKEFAANMSMQKYEIGDVIVRDGDSGDTMFIIGEGIVDVHISVNQAENSRVACLVDGEYFGEMALLCGERRSATIAARTDVVLYEIQRSTVKRFIQQYPDFAEKISVSIAKRQLSNSRFRTSLIEQEDNEAKVASGLMNAFKKFLRDS